MTAPTAMLIGQVSTDANTKRPAELTREYQVQIFFVIYWQLPTNEYGSFKRRKCRTAMSANANANIG